MKLKHFIYSICLAGLTLSSCQKEEDLEGIGQWDRCLPGTGWLRRRSRDTIHRRDSRERSIHGLLYGIPVDVLQLHQGQWRNCKTQDSRRLSGFQDKLRYFYWRDNDRKRRHRSFLSGQHINCIGRADLYGNRLTDTKRKLYGHSDLHRVHRR